MLVQKKCQPFWKTRFMWLVILLMIIAVSAVIVASILLHQRSTQTRQNADQNSTIAATKSSVVQNSTIASVASSGLFLFNKTTWNMQIYNQKSSGDVQFRMTLDSSTFTSAQNVSLAVLPLKGSPLSATASTDSTGVVYVRPLLSPTKKPP
jgi:uncharacterized protein YpmS